VDTVCKEYDHHTSSMQALSPVDSWPTNFATMFQKLGVGLVVRANYDNEPGMPARVYSDDTFAPQGLLQANIRVVDQNGGLPRPQDVARLLEVGENFMSGKSGGAILVHCKGGFGRSVVLAACLAIERVDISGAAALGLFRIMRPGAITTRRQEAFLKSFKGAADVRRFAKLPLPDGGSVSAFRKRVTLSTGSIGRCFCH